MKTNKRMHVTL